MKKLILTFAGVFALGLLTAQTLNEKGLYIDSEGELFSGTISQLQNTTKSQFSVKEGVIEGEAAYFYASGTLMESGFFTKGQKDQKWTRYSENGSVIAIAFYTLGKKSGTWLVFDDKGKKRFEMNYNDGQKSGIWTSWDENGALLSTVDYTKVN
jgi:antitoxin component YwqK of YwqJK toxin-antitoxin module